MPESLDTVWRVLVQYSWAVGAGIGVVVLVFLIRWWLRGVREGPARPATAFRPIEAPAVSSPERRRGSKAIGNPDRRLADEHQRYQSIVDDLKEDKRVLEERVERLRDLNSIVAPLVKELNANVDRRRMGPIVLRVLERIFNPSQSLVFFLEPDGETLTLTAQHGADELEEGYQLRVGEGFTGTVAKKKLLMVREDLRNESNLMRQRIRENEPDCLVSDIAAPIVSRGRVHGVICMGGAGRLSEDDRTLFGMIGDMTSLALTNYLQYRKIEELANSDPLTQIYNKGYFLELCDRELATARREGAPMSVLMLDVDHFKHYNDTNGHLAGDRALKTLADILKKKVREQDTVARFGGEEFVVLLHGEGPEGAVRAAERIRLAVAGHPFMYGERQPLGLVSVSIGAASMPEHAQELQDLIQKADESLYAAKKGGRNRVVSASSRVEVISF